jgi:hypothetical protein
MASPVVPVGAPAAALPLSKIGATIQRYFNNIKTWRYSIFNLDKLL